MTLHTYIYRVCDNGRRSRHIHKFGTRALHRDTTAKLLSACNRLLCRRITYTFAFLEDKRTRRISTERLNVLRAEHVLFQGRVLCAGAVSLHTLKYGGREREIGKKE
jgi:hypothetical protein